MEKNLILNSKQQNVRGDICNQGCMDKVLISKSLLDIIQQN